MSGRRLLAIVVGVVGILILVVVVFLLLTQGDDQPEEAAAATPVTVVDGTPVTPAPDVTPTATIDPASQMVEVVVSLQTVPRGWQMTEAELTTEMRLASEVGTNFITRLEDAIGSYARQDIYQGETMTTDTLVKDPTLIGVENFGPSSLVPQGWVAMAIPTDRLASVSYGVRPGDSVDVMLTFTLSSIDQDFQTLLFNSATFFLSPVGPEGVQLEGTIFVIDPYGRFEVLGTGDTAHVGPSEDTQRPIPISVILQNARVIEVGTFQPRQPAQPPTPTPAPDEPTPTPDPAPPTPTPEPPNVLLLALPPQQQLFLDYALEVTADIDLAMRRVNDAQLYAVQNVDINYLLQQYNITIPPNTEYTIGGLESTSLESGEVIIDETAP